MTVLCLDTSSASRVALVEGDRVIARAENPSARHHAESVTVLVREALAQAGMDTALAPGALEFIAVGTGPAPFTGLRAGLVTARTLGFVADCPIHGVASLDVVARAALDRLAPDAQVVAVSDARRREVYWQRCAADGVDDVTVSAGPDVSAPGSVANELRDGTAFLVPDGVLPAHAVEALAGAPEGPALPLDPAVMVRLVRARLARGDLDRLGVEPLYLRRPDIHGQPVERM